MADWSELGKDLLGLIVDKMSIMEDIVHFGAVCRTWHYSVVEAEKWDFPNTASPWLMLGEKEDNDSDKRGFFSLFTNKVYYFDLPEARGRSCVSSKGWLLTLGLDLEIHLLNPLTRKRIRLPHLTTVPLDQDIQDNAREGHLEYDNPKYLRTAFIQKVILSSTPTLPYNKEKDEERCVVMMIISELNKMVFLRLGDDVWTLVHSNGVENIRDVVYFNGQFYAVTFRYKLVLVDISSTHAKTITIAEAPEGAADDIPNAAYLVESAGELLMVLHYVYEEFDEPITLKIHQTVGFDVYKFNFDSRKWTKVKSRLKERAVFVGCNSSFSILPSIDNLRCKPNCIYFTDINRVGLQGDMYPNLRVMDGVGTDIGAYSMESDDIVDEDLYVGPDIVSYICTPIWICPFRNRDDW